MLHAVHNACQTDSVTALAGRSLCLCTDSLTMGCSTTPLSELMERHIDKSTEPPKGAPKRSPLGGGSEAGASTEAAVWGGVQVAVQEVRRLQKYGVTAGELTNYKAALMRDSEHLAEQWQSVPSADTLDYCMECLALNHTFMAQEEVRCCAVSAVEFGF